MSPEELKLVEEFTVALDSAHTQIFSTHLQKQLKDLQGYIEKHSNEIEKFSQKRLDKINNDYNEQIKNIKANYEKNNIELSKEFNEKLQNLLSIIKEPVDAAHLDTKIILSKILEEMKTSFINGKNNSDSNYKNLNTALSNLSLEFRSKITEHQKQLIEKINYYDSKISQRLDDLDKQSRNYHNVQIAEQKKDRIYLWGPLLFSIFLILVLYISLNYHSIIKMISK